ncbi:MAG: hypothetical protein LBS41_04925 [Streptococcaceae bacterium]|jgi:hypothetical protein|nr:hypothetical protein [Streptococcaceae bacterium]
MNYKDLVNEVKKQTGEKYEVCSDIVNGYEKYCEDEIKRPFKKEVDEHMIEWVSSYTKHDNQTVSSVLTVLITLVRKEVKSKIPFMK